MAKTRQMALTPDLVARAHRAREDPGPNRCWAYHTDDDYDVAVQSLLASHPGGPDKWLFAYGSLIWRPELSACGAAARTQLHRPALATALVVPQPARGSSERAHGNWSMPF